MNFLKLMSIMVLLHLISFSIILSIISLGNSNLSDQDDEDFVMSLRESNNPLEEGQLIAKFKLGIKKKNYVATQNFKKLLSY
jgi:hypothetical protein